MSNPIEDYIAKQSSPQKEILRELRSIILATFPGTKEEMKWGVPSFADGKFYIVALKDHVNMGFSTAGLTREEIAQFDGGGKTTKHIQVKTLDEIDRERITTLLKLVENRSGGK